MSMLEGIMATLTRSLEHADKLLHSAEDLFGGLKQRVDSVEAQLRALGMSMDELGRKVGLGGCGKHLTVVADERVGEWSGGTGFFTLYRCHRCGNVYAMRRIT